MNLIEETDARKEIIHILKNAGARIMPDRAWNPFACAAPQFLAIPIPLLSGDRARMLCNTLAQSAQGPSMSVMVLADEPPNVEVEKQGLRIAYTVVTDFNDLPYLYQRVLVRETELQPRFKIFGGQKGDVYQLLDEKVTAWDGKGRKEPITRRSGQFQAVQG